MKLTEQKLLEYARGVRFWLKDYEKTKRKHGNYKTEKRQSILENISLDIDNIVDDGVYEMTSNQYGYDMSKILDSKANIRQLKTLINSYTRQSIENNIDYMTDNNLNKNELKCFTIRFYLENYEEVNEKMSLALCSFLGCVD